MNDRTAPILISALLLTSETFAGTYLFAGDGTNSVDIVTHPETYTHNGGDISIRVCIAPTSPNAAEMEIPIQNNINVFNLKQPTTQNLKRGAGNNIPSGHFDLESVTLHELGHCLGMAHVNAASESGLSPPDIESTKATDGGNMYDIDPGADGVVGSSDDIRGDDVNLHWFRKSNNDPFTISNIIDETTYSRDITDLPSGHNFAANGSRAVSSLLGYGNNTEVVMQQGTHADEAQRSLGHDDVATIRFAESGIDQISGTSDDYTVTLEYGGISDIDCDISVSITNTASLGFCYVEGILSDSSLPSRQRNRVHVSLINTHIELGSSYNWFFNDETVNQPPSLGSVGDQTLAENANTTLNLTAVDPEGNSISYSSDGLPAFATLTDLGGGDATLDITPSTGDAGIYNASIIVTDDGLPNVSSQEDITITVTNNTVAPTLSPIGNHALTEGDNLNLIIVATDAEGHQINFSGSGLNDFISLNDQGDGTALLDVTPVPGDAGDYSVTISIADDGVPSLSDEETINITVDALDSDGDSISDFDEVNVYMTDPNNPDSDGDLLNDALEISFSSDPNDDMSWPNIADGDLAPLDNPDGLINAADLLIGQRIVLDDLTPAALQFAHGDLYPPGSPDGIIDASDLILLRQLVLE